MTTRRRTPGADRSLFAFASCGKLGKRSGSHIA